MMSIIIQIKNIMFSLQYNKVKMILFNCSDDYILEDERVMLRPLQEDDIANLLTFSLEEPDLWKYSSVSGAGEEALKKYLEYALVAKLQGKEYPFIVFDKSLKEYAGSTRFYDINLLHSSLQLGYTWYGKRFQRTGLNRHCKYLLLSFAFEQLGLERVEFRADNNNTRSINAMKAIGCQVEGVLRSHMPKREGGRRDSIILSILKEEWYSITKENLRRKIY